MKNYVWLIAALTTTGLLAEEAATINRAKVNVRGGPSFASEVVGQLQKGDPVTFIEEVIIDKPKAGEPSRWAAIKLPSKTPVWVFHEYLNDKTVKIPRLNLRAGPGENYSVVGRLQRGDTVKEIRSVEGWMQIETPENARAYVDANYVTRTNAPAVAAAVNPAPEAIKVFQPKNEPPTTVAAKPAETVTPPPTTVAEAPKTVEIPKSTETPKVQEPPKSEPAVVKEEAAAIPAKPEEAKPQVQPAVETPKPVETATTIPITPLPAPTTPTPTTNPPPATASEPARVLPQIGQPVISETNTVLIKRVVRREGEVRSTKFNIQAPTYFELVNEGRIINYLSGDKAGVKLKDYKGLRVTVTGEESIDRRYKERPLLEIETIEVAP